MGGDDHDQQRRFLTWGIVIAVFGMRLVFPLLVVVIAARIGPLDAVRLAATEPARYAQLIDAAHLPIAAFGGSFLMLVGLLVWFTLRDWRRPAPLTGPDTTAAEAPSCHDTTAAVRD